MIDLRSKVVTPCHRVGDCGAVVVSTARRSDVGCVPVLSFLFLRYGYLSETRLRGPAAPSASPAAAPHLQWVYEYESGSDSDADRPDPDLVLDDLAGRRFHSPSPAPPANFAVPAGPLAAAGCPRPPPVTMAPRVAPRPNASGLRSENARRPCAFDVPLMCPTGADCSAAPTFSLHGRL